MLQGNEKNNRRTRLSDQEPSSGMKSMQFTPGQRKFGAKEALWIRARIRNPGKRMNQPENPIPGGGKQGGNSGEEEEREPSRERWMGHK
jgi:hypothetical protein